MDDQSQVKVGTRATPKRSDDGAASSGAGTVAGVEGRFEHAYPTRLRDEERRKVLRRRYGDDDEAERTKVELGRNGMPADAVGFALSGGGIRSATFCLGVFQSLARLGLLRDIDFMSTVSGGGFFGGFLGRLFTRPWLKRPRRLAPGADGAHPVVPAVPKPAEIAPIVGESTGPDCVERILSDAQSPPVDWLRENGRYLSPNGSGDSLLAAAIYLRNLVAVHLVLGVSVLCLMLAASFGRAVLTVLVGSARAGKLPALMGSLVFGAIDLIPRPGLPAEGAWLWWSPYLAIPLLLLVLAVFPLGWAYWMTQRREPGGLAPHVPLLFILFFSLAHQVWVTGWSLEYQALEVPESYAVLSALTAMTSALTLTAWLVGQYEARGLPEPARTGKLRADLSRWLSVALAVTAATAAVALVDSLGQTLYAIVKAHGLSRVFRTPAALPPVAALLALVAFANKLLPLLNNLVGDKRLKLRAETMAWVPALLLALIGLVAVSALAHGVAWVWQTPAGNPGNVLWKPPATPTPVCPACVVPTGKGPACTAATGRTPAASPRQDHHGKPPDPSIRSAMSWPAAGIGLLIALLLSWLFGHTFEFLNLSSHHALYGSRLTRAYLGASNPERWKPTGRRVTEPLKDDNADFLQYAPSANGGPLHLVNVTLNETVSGQYDVEQLDRKGFPVALGPCGLSAAKSYHALWRKGIALPWHLRIAENVSRVLPAVMASWLPWANALERASREDDATPPSRAEAGSGGPTPTGYAPDSLVKLEALNWSTDGFHLLADKSAPIHEVERLDLGQWLAVSGAAFTTGLGVRSSMALSLLAGLTNVRLGYWWDSGVEPGDRADATPLGGVNSLMLWLSGAFPVQSYLFEELLARFHGPARSHWYLSDGGHFENTGCYELIRRRIPYIVVCDCGADPQYQLDDIGDLVRKVRIDFGANVELLGRKDYESAPAKGAERVFGAREDLSRAPARQGDGVSLAAAHAVLARVSYEDDPKARSLILFVKPGLTGDEPCDVLNYARTHDTFPQESTLDQFFDEAQWESYRKLGEHIGDKVFGGAREPEHIVALLKRLEKRRRTRRGSSGPGVVTEVTET
jgi:hypothetical protein